jgi:hypothetical protein
VITAGSTGPLHARAPGNAPFSSSAPRNHVAILIVIATALLAYLPALGNGFAYDDVPIVQQDTRVQALTSFGDIFTNGYWQDASLALYRPLTTLSFAIDHAIGNGSPAWFHASNLLMHAAVSVLVLLLLAPFFGNLPGLAGALVFALHPVHVEAVANIVGRAEMLSAFFFLAACILWLPRTPAAHGPSAWRAIAVLACFALALLAKESAATLPAILLLLDGITGAARRDRLHPWLRERAPLIAAMLVIIVCYGIVRAAVLGSFVPGRVDPVLEVATGTGARIWTALQAWPVWFRLLFVPDVLLADYGPGILWPATGPNGAGVLGLVIALTMVTIGVLAFLSGRMLLAVGALWFPITILPVSNLLLPIGVLVAERTLYLPSVALSFLVCAAALALAQTGSGTRRVAAAAFAIVLALFGVRTALRAPVWDSTDSVMIALVEDRPDAFRGRWHLARMARNAGQMVHAMNEYDAAIAIWPRRQSLILEATAFAAEQQRVDRAFELAQLAASQWPDDVAVQRVLAGTALDAGQFGVARDAIRAGLALEPTDAMLLRMAAFIDSVGGGAS